MRIPSGTTDQYIYFVAVDSTDFTTRETGLTTFTVYRSRNGGAAAAYTTPTINETDATNMPGVYELLLDEDMAIDSGDDSQEICLHITHAGMAPVTRTFELYRPKITAGNTLDVTATGAAGIDWGNVENQSTSVSLSSTTVNATFTDDAKLTSGTAQSVTASTIQLASGETFADDEIIGSVVVVTGGTTGVGQSRVISDYVSSTDTATISPDWTTTPSGTITYAVYASPPAPTATAALPTVLVSSGTGTGQLSVTSGVVASSVSSMGAGVVTASAIATGAIDADAIAADAVTEIQSGLATAAALATVDSNVDTVVSGVITGAAATGTLSTTQATSNLTGYADDQLIGRVIIWTSGACDGEATDITDYANTGGLLTFTALTTAPGNGDTFKIV